MFKIRGAPTHTFPNKKITIDGYQEPRPKIGMVRSMSHVGKVFNLATVNVGWKPLETSGALGHFGFWMDKSYSHNGMLTRF
jgi:hypothetical protein